MKRPPRCKDCKRGLKYAPALDYYCPNKKCPSNKLKTPQECLQIYNDIKRRSRFKIQSEELQEVFDIVVTALESKGYKGGGGGNSLMIFSKPEIKIFIQNQPEIFDQPILVIRHYT